jgi:hypothetical protein
MMRHMTDADRVLRLREIAYRIVWYAPDLSHSLRRDADDLERGIRPYEVGSWRCEPGKRF